MPVTTHLEELRTRLLHIIIAVGIGFVACYFFKEKLFEILARPLVTQLPDQSVLIFTSLPEAFFTYLKVSLLGSLFLTSPYTLFQIWKFISPGLYSSEKRYVVPFVMFSTIFFLSGALFAYFLVFPLGFKFFVGFTTDFIKPMFSIREYLSFSMKLLIAFGVIFELPIFMYFLARIGMVSSKTLTTQRKYAILLIFIIAALLTPPDVVTQCLMAVPLMILYEISVWIVRLGERKRARNAEEPDKGDVTEKA
ncbi:MAG: twin-arginine translocase subunit TatC [Deltaproteobacteria bacterium]|nr:twin-arginine translocase subunit TatC [Deltaproteobacteria bacterium]